MARILLVATHLLIHTALSQSSVCISGANGDNYYLNGEYTSVGTRDGKPYYHKPSCSGYDEYLYYDSTYNEWFIDDDLDTYYVFAYCESSSLSNCDSNSWWVYATDWTLSSSVSASFGVCPKIHIWPCDTVYIPTMWNGCDKVFDRKIGENVWTDSTSSYYWYWYEPNLQWQCDDEPPETGACSSSNAYTTEGWIDISGGQSKSLHFEYPDFGYHTVQCIMDPTPKPTKRPTDGLTNPPSSQPTVTPTLKPTSIPTVLPTVSPTILPTNSPSFVPSLPPTQIPTFLPTSVPLVGATFAPSFLPTSTPPFHPTMDPSISPAEWITAHQPTGPQQQSTIHLAEGEVHEMSTTFITALTTDAVQFEPNANKNQSMLPAVLVSIVVLFCCMVCVVIAWKYYRNIEAKENQNKVALAVNDKPASDKPVPNSTSAIELNMNVQRERVYTESQYAENDTDEKEIQEPGAGVDEGDSNTSEIIPGSFVSSITDGADSFVTGITEGAHEKEIYDERNAKGRELLKQWLTGRVKLPQYYDILVNNGYETLDIVKEITGEDELREIGIVLKGHVLKLMKEVKRLETYVE